MEAQTQRVLGAVRQSKTRDRALSPDTQKKRIHGWIADNDATLARFTEDLSTSGSRSAFTRKGLGPWLTEPDKIKAWDVLVVTRLDRACRNVADYLKLSTWCDRNGKRFVVLDDPSLDTSTPGGRALATMRATFAQYEREMAVERNKDTRQEQIELGHWPGGRLPYGWRYDHEARKLVPDTGGTADVLATMADMAIAGKSQGQIADWLNSHGHLTVIGRQWRTDTVRRVLRHANTAELLGDTKSAQLRAAMRNREQTRGERTNGHMLLRVAYCRQCGSPLYCQVKRDRPSGGYYRCLECKIHMRMDKLEQQTENALLFLYGHLRLVELELVPGDDHQAAIHALERDIAALEKITGTELVVASKQAEIEHLRNEPFEPDHYVPVPQDITVAAHWDSLDDAGKGAFLRTRHVRVFADKHNFEFRGGLLEESEVAERYLEPLEPPATR
jgi:DNA invertase Pin-like site-specific DNA recombinase